MCHDEADAACVPCAKIPSHPGWATRMLELVREATRDNPEKMAQATRLVQEAET